MRYKNETTYKQEDVEEGCCASWGVFNLHPNEKTPASRLLLWNDGHETAMCRECAEDCITNALLILNEKFIIGQQYWCTVLQKYIG